MKKSNLFIIILTLLVTNITGQAIKNPTYVITAEEIQGKNNNQTNIQYPRTKSSENTATYYDKIIFDNNGNLYLAYGSLKRILKFTADGKYQRDIIIPEEYFQNGKTKIPSFYPSNPFDFLLSADNEDNLFVIITVGERFYNIVKFDSTGNIKRDFNIQGRISSERITGICTDESNNLYIGSFPFDFNPYYAKDGLIYVYNNTGKFLTRTDYAVAGNGLVYKQVEGKEGFDCFGILEAPEGEEILKSNKLRKIDEICIKRVCSSCGWSFKYLDKSNNAYFINSDSDVLVYDKNHKFLKEIKVREKSDLVGATKILINNNGDIFHFGYEKGANKKPNLNKYIGIKIDK